MALIASGVLSGLASVLLRLAALRGGVLSIDERTSLLFPLAAIGSYGIGFVLYAFALRKTSLDVAYPLMIAVSMLVVQVFTAVNEQALKPMQLIGALVILGGVWLVMRQV